MSKTDIFLRLRTFEMCWHCCPLRLFLFRSIWVISPSWEPSFVYPWLQGGWSRHQGSCILLTTNSQLLKWEGICPLGKDMSQASTKREALINSYCWYASDVRRWQWLVRKTEESINFCRELDFEVVLLTILTPCPKCAQIPKI